MPERGEVAQGMLARLHNLVVGGGEQAHRPVGAEEQPFGAEPLEEVRDVRDEVVRLPVPPVGLGDEPRDLARDVLEARERGHQRSPGLELTRCDRRLRRVVDHEPQLRKAARDLQRGRKLARPHEQVVREARRLHGGEAALHVVPQEPRRIGLVVHLVTDADEVRALGQRLENRRDIGRGEYRPTPRRRRRGRSPLPAPGSARSRRGSSAPARARRCRRRVRRGSAAAPRARTPVPARPSPRSSSRASRPRNGRGRRSRRQLVPELDRDRGLEQVEVPGELGGRAGAEEDARDRGVPKRELERSRRERHAVPGADGLEPRRFLEQLARRGPVVEGRPAGEEAAVEDAARDHGDPALRAEREQFGQRGLVEQRVPARDEEAVEVGLAREPEQHLGLVHACAHRSDHALAAQPVERGVGARDGVLVVVVRVVDVQDVDAVETEPLEALLDRAEHPVVAEVEDRIQGRDASPDRLARLGGRVRAQQAPDLRREHEVVARPPGEDTAEALLRQAEAVEGRGVEEADAPLPGQLDRRVRGLVADRLEQPAERCGAQPRARELDHAAAQTAPAGKRWSARLSGRSSAL